MIERLDLLKREAARITTAGRGGKNESTIS
jgi:hypothetical protein